MENTMIPSPFEWRTGAPSIMASLQKDANIAKKASENQGTRFRHDPVNLPKKQPRKVRDGSGRTKPLAQRLDFELVREFRLQGRSWREVAAHFGCCLKSIHEQSTSMFPELRHHLLAGKKSPGTKPKAMPLEQIAAEMLAGASLRGSARRHGFSHVSLRYRLMQIPAGVQALQAAKTRADAVNAQKKAQAQDRRNVCQFMQQGDKDREALR